MTDSLFYGVENSPTISYLEFGEIDLNRGEKKVWDFRLHQKAYDWLMLGRYANDLAVYTEMNHLLGQGGLDMVFDLYKKEIHHPDDFATHFDKLVALSLVQQKQEDASFFELGHTIFGCIEGIIFCQNLLNQFEIIFPQVNIKAIEWQGVDISKLFNLLAEKFHQTLKIKTSTELTRAQKRTDVFFSKGITLLYAIKEIDQLFNLITDRQLSIFDYSLTLGEREVTTIGSGKRTEFLSFESFVRSYRQNKKSLYVKNKTSRLIADKNRVWIDCLYGEDAICRNYINQHSEMCQQLLKKSGLFVAADHCFKTMTDNHWIPFETFLQKLADS